MNFDSIGEYILGLLVGYVPRLVLAVVALYVGFWLARKLAGLVAGQMEKRETDPTLRSFLTTMIAWLLKIMVVISVASMVGVAMTSFIAILGAAGLAVGLALQGSLANFAGGVLILIFKPFKVGDVITAQGFTASVKEIQIFQTILKTPDNRTIIIPNAKLSNDSLVNFSMEPRRRVDLVFGIGYGDDIEKARTVLKGIIEKDERILKDPEPFVRVSELADSSVNFTLRLWVDAGDFWGVHFDMIERVKKEFDANKISIPYPQMDVHVDKLV